MKYIHVLLACAAAAIVSAVPLGNSLDDSLVTRSDNFDVPSQRRALDNDELDLFVRALDEELAARDVDYADQLTQRDFDEPLERRLLKWWHKFQANRAQMKAEKYTAKADRQRDAANGFKGATGGPAPGGDTQATDSGTGA